MSRFEDAILWVRNGGRARRHAWAKVTEYTRTTPPLNYERCWHIWLADVGSIINGWGGSIGGAADDDSIRDGDVYSPKNEDRIADDWELLR